MGREGSGVIQYANKVKTGATNAAPRGSSAVSDVVEQNFGLAGHSASPHGTALVLNVSLSTARFWIYVGFEAIFRASWFGTRKTFFELAQNTPMAQTCTKVDIFVRYPRTPAKIAGASLSALKTNSV